MEVSISQLGNIGEFVSGVAVLITLAFLAFQIRDGNKATRFDSRVRSRALVAEHQKLLVNPEMGRIWLEGLKRPDALSPEERLSFYNLMYLLVNAIELQYLSQWGIDQRDVTMLSGMVESAGFQRWWRQAQDTYTGGFREFISRQVSGA